MTAARRIAGASAFFSAPIGVAAAFLPIAIAVWLLLDRLSRGPDPDAYAGLRVVQVVMFVAGLALYAYLARDDAPEAGLGRRRRWIVAAAALAAALAAQAAVLELDPRWALLSPYDASPAMAQERLILVGLLAHEIVLVAAAEELWFRGLWMRAAGGSALLAIGVGALAFGLFHWPHGPWTVATTTAIGALYGAARWRGAPIWSLALAHGLGNWISRYGAPGSWRFDEALARGLLCVLLLGAAAAILLLWRPAWRG